MRNQIVLYLLKIGVKPHYKGFNYLVSALAHTMDSITRIPMLELYDLVAEEYGITSKQVERCIRTLIGIFCEAISPPLAYKYTNAEFIYLCTMNIKMDCEANER